MMPQSFPRLMWLFIRYDRLKMKETDSCGKQYSCRAIAAGLMQGQNPQTTYKEKQHAC
jgi:hypothetical protein